MFIDKNQTKEITLNILVEMDKTEREKITSSLTEKQSLAVFDEITTLTKLLKQTRSSEFGVKNSAKAAHLQKFPEGRFWDFPEFRYKDKQNPEIVAVELLTGDEYEGFILVSSKGDVVHLDVWESGKLIIYSAGDADTSVNKRRRVVCEEYTVYVSELVACTFLEYTIKPSLFAKRVIHKDGLNWNDEWSNLQFSAGQKKQ